MKTNQTFIKRYVLLVFLLLTPLLSLAIPLFLSLPPELVPLIVATLPAVMAISLAALTDGRKGIGALLRKLSRWRAGLKWYLIAVGVALVLRLTMSLLALLLGWISSIQFNDWSPAQYLIIGIFTLIGALMEELGWRGYVLPRLLARRSALGSALIIGIPWGVLHLGLILPGQMNAGTSWVGTILFTFGLSMILTWFFIQTQYGIVIGIVYHTAQNFFVFLNGGITSTESLWLMTAVTVVIAIILIIVYGTRLQRSSTNPFAIIDTR